MTTLFPESPSTGGEKQNSIVDDFMYGSNVASSNVYIRMGFLRKVFGILSAQLLLTTIVGSLFVTIEPIRTFIHGNQWLLLTSVIVSFIVLFALMVKSRETPLNYILLAIFTICESILVGTVASMYEVHSVVEAFALTCGVVIALTTYTLQSKRDFSSWGAGLFAVLWTLIMAGFLQIFFQSEMLDKALAIGGAVLFSLFIIYDVHMIMHKVSPEEYIHASINLYLDIINLFLHILRIIGEARRN